MKNVNVITATCYLSMLFLGASISLVGAAARNIGLSAEQIGFLVAAQNVGFMASVFTTGTLSDSRNKARLLMVGSMILALGLLTFYATGVFWINLIVIALVGVGTATYEGVTDPLLVDIHSERASAHINVNHFFVNLGSALITFYLIFLQADWRRSAVQAGLAVLVLAVLYGLMQVETKRQSATRYVDRLRAVLQDRHVLVLAAATVTCVGVELGSMGILTTFLMELRGFTQVTSKAALVVFLLGMALGRLLVGLLLRKGSLTRAAVVLFGLSVPTFFALYFVPMGGLIYPVIGLGGLTLSALYPLVLALAGALHPEAAGSAMAVLKLSGGVGGFLMPALMSLATRAASLQAAMAVYPLACVAGLALMLGFAASGGRRASRWAE
ncbi:MAG: MFS transporter [Anaerolineae bacterium]|nr:MFS transporter [Anaerolineae bacterium]